MDAVFLKLDNIKGKSQAEGFKDQIEAMSYSQNVATQVSNDVSGGAGDKPLETMSLNFTKKSEGAQRDSGSSVWDLEISQKGK
ncbi:type VI secretion system tube protein Hcp [Salmonella enterica]